MAIEKLTDIEEHHVVTSQTGFTAVKNPPLLDMIHDDPDYAPAVAKVTVEF